MSGRSPARLLAPVALVVTVVAFFVVVTSEGDPETESNPAAQTTQGTSKTETTEKKPSSRKSKRYTVKAGDTPSAIAEKVGISLDTLLELNPDVDPQLLSPGQRLKISP